MNGRAGLTDVVNERTQSRVLADSDDKALDRRDECGEGQHLDKHEDQLCEITI
jgi:hypothetical protein